MVYKSHPGGNFYRLRSFYYIERSSLWKSFRKRGKFKTHFLAARQFINPTQAPWWSAANKGHQDREKYNTLSFYTVNTRPNMTNFVRGNLALTYSSKLRYVKSYMSTRALNWINMSTTSASSVDSRNWWYNSTTTLRHKLSQNSHWEFNYKGVTSKMMP